MCLKAVIQRLLDKCIAIGKEEHFLRVGALQENVDEPHGGPSFSGTRRHDEQRAAFSSLEGLGHPADGLVLIGTFDNLFVDRRVFEGLLVLADKAQAPQVIGREESSDRTGMCEVNVPEEMMQAVRHKAERGNALLGSNLGHVMAELLFALASVACGLLGFDYGKDRAIDIVEAEVGEPVPGRGIITLDGNLELHLRVVAEVPPRAL